MKTIYRKILSITIILTLILTSIGCSNGELKTKINEKLQESTATTTKETTDQSSEKELSPKLEGDLKVHFINVGQADAILIQQGSHNMMIDGGNNEDEKTLKNYITNLGISEFEYVVGTHVHEDHIGSLDYIISAFNVGNVYFPKQTATTKTYKDFIKAVQNKNLSLTVPKVGESFMLGDAKCTIIAPNGTKYDDANNYSIVIKLEYGDNSFLFCGDAEDISEKEMLSNGLDLKADVLKVGHHGSASSSTKKFLSTVNPKFGVISVGVDNDYNHPSINTMNKFKDMGIGIYRTDENGTIVATSDGHNITFNTSCGSYNGK